MVRMTSKRCARCTNMLASSNHNRDRLCGQCQRELGPTGPNGSAAFRTWVASGRRREVDREPAATVPVAPAATTAEVAALEKLGDADLVRLARETSALVERRRQAAEALLRTLGAAPAAVPEQ